MIFRGVRVRKTIPILNQFMKFGLVGVSNTLLTLGVIFLLEEVVHADYRIANAIGYALGLANSFLLNRRWTFKSCGGVPAQICRFLLVFCLCYAVQFGLLALMVTSFRWMTPRAQVVAMALYTCMSYVLSRRFVYR
jgi:putative flippase GtrA